MKKKSYATAAHVSTVRRMARLKTTMLLKTMYALDVMALAVRSAKSKIRPAISPSINQAYPQTKREEVKE
jgi:hypothetical protein